MQAETAKSPADKTPASPATGDQAANRSAQPAPTTPTTPLKSTDVANSPNPYANAPRRRVGVQGLLIDVLNWDMALGKIEYWAAQRESRVVAICNAHSVVTAKHDSAFNIAVQSADMTTADGMPVAWMLRRLGFPTQQRINGPDLMLRYCERAAISGQKIFLYGNEQSTLTLLSEKLRQDFPGLQLAGAISPPFRELTDQEDQNFVREINDSGAQLVFVSLGCPKQEKWMAEHRSHINAVMIGVGAAFDYHAGTIKRAPLWMRNIGLEWLHRLASEPRRLWRRYFVTNSAFIVGAARQLMGKQKQQYRPED